MVHKYKIARRDAFPCVLHPIPWSKHGASNHQSSSPIGHSPPRRGIVPGHTGAHDQSVPADPCDRGLYPPLPSRRCPRTDPGQPALDCRQQRCPATIHPRKPGGGQCGPAEHRSGIVGGKLGAHWWSISWGRAGAGGVEEPWGEPVGRTSCDAPERGQRAEGRGQRAEDRMQEDRNA